MPGHVAEMIFAPETEAGPVQSVTPGVSPYTYTATQAGSLSISGGTVSLATFARGSVSLTLGLTGGLVPVATGDKITITYLSAPTLYFIPR